MISRWLASLLLVLVCCGGGGKSAVEDPGDRDREGDGDGDEPRSGERRSAVPDIDDDDDDDNEGMEIEGLGGTISKSAIKEGLAPHTEAIGACHSGKTRKRRFVGGHVELAVLVNRDGTVKTVTIKQSDLGAWDVERCLLELVRTMEFGRPKGGEADFDQPVDFSPRQNVKWWPEERADSEVEDKLAELAECPSQPRDVWVTFYVGTRGAVKSVGFSSPSKMPIADEWVDCAASAIEAWTLSDPEGHIAKSGFRYNPE
jgi:TonB family protein